MRKISFLHLHTTPNFLLPSSADVWAGHTMFNELCPGADGTAVHHPFIHLPSAHLNLTFFFEFWQIKNILKKLNKLTVKPMKLGR